MPSIPNFFCKKQQRKNISSQMTIQMNILLDEFKNLEIESDNFQYLKNDKQVFLNTQNLLRKFITLKKEIQKFAGFRRDIVLLEQAIEKLHIAMKKVNRLQDVWRELINIQTGLYQNQLYTFTYRLNNPYYSESVLKNEVSSIHVESNVHNKESFIVLPLLDRGGLKCTAAIPTDLQSSNVEIQINFFGTIDFASKVADMEKGGPGQATLKKYEAKLLEQVNSILEQMSINYPDKTFRIRLAGHSLGGSLAKGFAHSMQKAWMLQKNTPEKIIKGIKEELDKTGQENNEISSQAFKTLKEKLDNNKKQFKELGAFFKIEGITLYALGAPGVDITTDVHASLLTYFHQPDFLRVYNHHHAEDIITKFGDTEFLAGKNGIIPRVITNKALQYETTFTQEEIDQALSLPFPGITKRVMAAHDTQIDFFAPDNKYTECELIESDFLLEKFSFSYLRRRIYKGIFYSAQILASYETVAQKVPFLQSFQENEEIEHTTLLLPSRAP